MLSSDDHHGDDEDLDESEDASPSRAAFLAEAARAPAAEPTHGTDRTGDQIGPYVLTGKLGQGGMGVVYAARDRRLRRDVALKILRASAAADEERRRRFLREARAASAIAHPNVATVFEAGEADGTVYIAMERVRGRSLRAALEGASGGALPPLEAARLARDVARGLASAHGAGIVHRDLKPENVMIGEDGSARILDFGLAKRARGVSPSEGDTISLATKEGTFLGTPSYMSPEQARGEAVDARSDVFSLGVTLYEMLVGRRPFRGATPMQVLIAVDRDEPPAARALNPAVPRGLERILDRCLAKAPHGRYASAAELAADLDRFLVAPSGARPWTGAALALLAIAAAAVTIALAGPGPTHAPARASEGARLLPESSAHTAASPSPAAGSATAANGESATAAGASASPAPPRPVARPHPSSARRPSPFELPPDPLADQK